MGLSSLFEITFLGRGGGAGREKEEKEGAGGGGGGARGGNGGRGKEEEGGGSSSSAAGGSDAGWGGVLLSFTGTRSSNSSRRNSSSSTSNNNSSSSINDSSPSASETGCTIRPYPRDSHAQQQQQLPYHEEKMQQHMQHEQAAPQGRRRRDDGGDMRRMYYEGKYASARKEEGEQDEEEEEKKYKKKQQQELLQQQQQPLSLQADASTNGRHWSLTSSSLFLSSSNPYFNAGVGLALVGCVAAAGRRLWQLAQVWGRRRLLTSLEIPLRDPSYPWVLQWLVARGNISNHLGLTTTYCKDKAGNVTTRFNFIPSPGRHVVRYKETLMVVERMRSGEIVDLQTGTPWEALTLQTFSSKKEVIVELLEEARREALAKDAGKTVIYHSVGSEWRKYGEPKTIRPFSSVVLADGVAEQVYSDICSFLSSSQWYLDRGIPYRRGYLLHGPPGCGKTSFVMALAGKLRYNICTLNVGDPLMTDDRLQFLLATVPPQTLLLLEDIDSAVVVVAGMTETHIGSNNAMAAAAAGGAGGAGVATAKKRGRGGNEDEEKERRSPYIKTANNTFGFMRGITYSGLLNALDGVVATEERITFMTTNHPERLPDSLIRPGRVDIKVRIGYATPSQLRRQFLRFFPNEENAADTFVDILRDVQLSMAELQGFFQFCREDVSQALTMAAAWKRADNEARELVLRENREQRMSSSASTSAVSSDASSATAPASTAGTPVATAATSRAASGGASG